MISFIDALLNKITMYRLVLYHLIFLLLAALLLSALGLLSFSPFALMFSTLSLVAVCWVVNRTFSFVFEAPTNVESVYITALILALIITPAFSWNCVALLTWTGILAMASKFILAIRKKHIFNPAAFSVALTAFALNQSASWWIGTLWMLPFVLLGGALVVRKQRQFTVVGIMVVVAVTTILFLTLMNGFLSVLTLRKALVDSPLIFFATIMFMEPLTMPPTRKLQAVYGALVGVLFAPQLHIGRIFSTPELALLIGNVFSYSVSPKIRRLLRLREKIQVSPDVYDFSFTPNAPFAYEAGQYMEWTLPHQKPDTRGNRRYFTLASAPTEPDIRLGVKFYSESSSFKQSLFALTPGDCLVAAQLAGEFILPKDPARPCVLIAGGIGVTPYRSMIQQLLDTQKKRPITIFYAARTLDDFVYHEIFQEAWQKLQIPTIYVPSDLPSIPATWHGERGLITPELISKYVPEYSTALFYISGPHAMVAAFQNMLSRLGVARSHIKTDFFPGLV